MNSIVTKTLQRFALGLTLLAGIGVPALSNSTCVQGSGSYGIVVVTQDLGPFVIVEATVGLGGCTGNNIDAAFANSSVPFGFSACGASHIYYPLGTWADVSADPSLSCTGTLAYAAI